MSNTGVIEGVVKWDPDQFTTAEGKVIGRAKVEHQHEGWDKKSIFTVKGFGPFGEQVAGLSAGQKVKVKYEAVQEAWAIKDDNGNDTGKWNREVIFKVVDLKAEEPPADAFDDSDAVGDDEDIPF